MAENVFLGATPRQHPTHPRRISWLMYIHVSVTSSVALATDLTKART